MRAPTIPAWLLACCLAVAASALFLAGSAPAGSGCPTVIRDWSPEWIPGTDDLLYSHRESDWCDSPGARFRIPAAGGAAVFVETGVLSPDGTKLVYTEVAYAKRGIRVYDLSTGKSVQLTTADDHDPAWSPDGKTIAFTRRTTDRRDLYLMSAAGTELRRVTTATTVERPAFSPDGAWIAFMGSPSFDLEVIRTDGTGRKSLLSDVSDFEWASDPKRLAVVAGPRARTENAYLVGLDGTAERLGTSLWAPVFSANGSVAFATTDDAVRIFDATGRPVARLVAPRVPYRDSWQPAGPRLGWSPDGQRLAWTTSGRLAIAAADGTGIRTLTDLEAWTVAWSSDGTKLAVGAFVEPCLTRPGIFIVDAATLAVRRLTNDCRIVGTGARDTLRGTGDDDVIDGLGGDDRISAGEGDDAASGGPGDDVIAGSVGGDELDGGPGADAIAGGYGRDTLTGGPGRDRISAGHARDMVEARDGQVDSVKCGTEYDVATVDPNDRVDRDCEGVLRTAEDEYLEDSRGQTRLDGGPGDDVIVAYGANRLTGGAGDDQLFGGSGHDRISGGPGNDVLFGGRGRDRLEGGPGDDVLNATDRVREVLDCGPGRDVANADRGDVVRKSCERVRRDG